MQKFPALDSKSDMIGQRKVLINDFVHGVDPERVCNIELACPCQARGSDAPEGSGDDCSQACEHWGHHQGPRHEGGVDQLESLQVVCLASARKVAGSWCCSSLCTMYHDFTALQLYIVLEKHSWQRGGI